MKPANQHNFLLLSCSKLYAIGLEHILKKKFSNSTIETLCIKNNTVELIEFPASYSLVVVDLDFKTDELIQSLEYLKHKFVGVPILMLTKRKNIQLLEACKALQIPGYLLKDTDANLSLAITHLLRNEEYFSPQLVNLKKERIDNLTCRELQVLKLIVLGYNNTAIAQKLFISIETIKTHKRNIREKLGIKSVHGLISHYIANYS